MYYETHNSIGMKNYTYYLSLDFFRKLDCANVCTKKLYICSCTHICTAKWLKLLCTVNELLFCLLSNCSNFRRAYTIRDSYFMYIQTVFSATRIPSLSQRNDYVVRLCNAWKIIIRCSGVPLTTNDPIVRSDDDLFYNITTHFYRVQKHVQIITHI